MAGWSVNPHCFQWTGGIANKTIIGAHAPQGSTATAVRLSLSRQFITLIYNAVPKATKVYFIFKKWEKKGLGVRVGEMNIGQTKMMEKQN